MPRATAVAVLLIYILICIAMAFAVKLYRDSIELAHGYAVYAEMQEVLQTLANLFASALLLLLATFLVLIGIAVYLLIDSTLHTSKTLAPYP
jgi:hypothetical protein